MIFSKIAIRLSCFEQIFITIENLPAELYLKHLPKKMFMNMKHSLIDLSLENNQLESLENSEIEKLLNLKI